MTTSNVMSAAMMAYADLVPSLLWPKVCQMGNGASMAGFSWL